MSVTERHEQSLLGRTASASQQRLPHRSVAEHGLHANRRPCYAVTDQGFAPQPELTALIVNELIGNQPEQDNSA